MMLVSWVSLLQILRYFTRFRFLITLIWSCFVYVTDFIIILLVMMCAFSLSTFYEAVMMDKDQSRTGMYAFFGQFRGAFGDFE
jgi:hypothetical protein